MLVSIFDKVQLLDVVDVRAVTLPTGQLGGVWRGLAYPLDQSGKGIDVSATSYPPADCQAVTEQTASVPHVAIIDGDDQAYIVVSGLLTTCNQVAQAISSGGYEILRTGRYLGEPVDGVDGDWFIRIAKPAVLPTSLKDHLAQLIGVTIGNPKSEGADDFIRLKLLSAELLASRAREASLQTELLRLKIEGRPQRDDRAAVKDLEAAVIRERELRIAAENAAAQAQAAQNDNSVKLQIAVAPKLNDEIHTVLSTLLPRLKLLRDSKEVVAAEFIDRRSVYRTFSELHEFNERLPNSWKKLQGVDDWWERHVSTGQDDSGRAYARRTGREWEVLISHKGEQTRDISWLAKR